MSSSDPALEEELSIIDEHLRSEFYPEAITTIRPILESNDIKVQWKMAQLCWEYCNFYGSLLPDIYSCKQKLYTYLESKPNCGQTHKAIALLMCMDRQSSLNRQGFEQLNKLRDHIQKAIDYSPEDGYAHYMMGMFCFEIASSSIQFKKLCAALMPSPLVSTFEEALRHFQDAEILIEDNRSSVLLMAAQCLFKLGRRELATEYLKRCVINDAEVGPKYKLNTKFAWSLASVENVRL